MNRRFVEMRDSLMKENPELKMPQLAKKAGKLWKEMPQEDKQVYK